MPDPVAVATGWGERTAADLAGLLVELSRLLKALSFYEPGHDTCRELTNRTHRAWQAELARAGRVEIVLEGSALSSPGLRESLDPEPMRDLTGALANHAIQRLVFTPELTRETLSCFTELLCETEGNSSAGFATRLYSQTHGGIEVNGEKRPEHPLAPVTSTHSASLGSSLLGASVAPMDPQPPAPALPLADSDSRDPNTPSPPSPAAAEVPPDDSPNIQESPFLAPAYDLAGETLRLALSELDRCTDDRLYERYVTRIVEIAQELVRGDQVEEGFRASLVLVDHAAGQSGCSGAQARMAQTALEELVDKRLLSHIMQKACARGGAGVRPAQVLLQIGERSVPAILERLDEESDLERSAQLAAVVLALGEHAVPTLLRAISRQSGKRAQLAVRLAGELQSPKLVPILYSVLQDSGPAMRREAAKALVHIGNSEACDVLVKALTSKSEDLPRIAALSLGVLRDERATRPLIQTLDRSLEERRLRLAEVVIRALGQMQSRRDEIARRLAGILHERSLMRRKKQRGCKVAALAVLARHETDEARRAIVDATRDPDPEVSERARQILAGAEPD